MSCLIMAATVGGIVYATTSSTGSANSTSTVSKEDTSANFVNGNSKLSSEDTVSTDPEVEDHDDFDDHPTRLRRV